VTPHPETPAFEMLTKISLRVTVGCWLWSGHKLQHESLICAALQLCLC